MLLLAKIAHSAETDRDENVYPDRRRRLLSSLSLSLSVPLIRRIEPYLNPKIFNSVVYHEEKEIETVRTG